MSKVKTETQTFEILLPEFYAEEFKKKIQKLDRKCKRHNLPQVVVNYGKMEIVEHDEEKYPCLPITVEFEEIRVEGNWRVVASVEMVDDTDFTVVNGKIENASQYKDLDFYHCDHCGVRRYRSKIIIVENPEGERKVVGRTCVKDYIGISPAALMANLDFSAWLTYCANMPICDRDPDEASLGWGAGRPCSPDLEYYATVVVATMRANKWQYVKVPYYGYDECDQTPTSVAVSLLWSSLTGKDKKEREWAEGMIIPEDAEMAKKVIAELKKDNPLSRLDEDLNSFEYNVVVMMATDRVSKPAMLCGAMCRPLLRMVNPVKKSSIDVTKSEYFGDRGDKVELEVVWDRFRWIEGQSYSYYGGATDVLICTGHIAGTNNIVTWFSNNEGGNVVEYEDDKADYPLTNDKVVKVKATIKGHKDNGKYGKATLLNRVRLAK